MNATIEMRWKKSQIVKVVIEQISSKQQYDIDLIDFPSHVGIYGNLLYQGEPARLVGVRLSDSPDIISYAGCYWYKRDDGTIKNWSLYIGVSHAPGFRLTRQD